MGSGFIISCQARATSSLAVVSISRVLSSKCRSRNLSLSSRLCSSEALSNRVFSEFSHVQDPVDILKYREVFSRRMAMAGLKPHHRIGHSLTSPSLSFGFFFFFVFLILVPGKCWKWKGKERTEIFKLRISQFGLGVVKIGIYCELI